MKKIVCLILVFQVLLIARSQNKFPAMDKSPMDMSYYPPNYPILKIQKTDDKALEPLIARVIYSRPQKNGRTVFGELLEYNKIWRLGANEATEIEFYKDVKIGNTKVKKGRYTLYCLPNTDKWTLIINKDNDVWGAFKYDTKKDVVRMDAAVQHTTELQESFTLVFEKNGTGFNLVMAWDDDIVKMPISF